MKHLHATRRRHERGAAALLVVVVLFFILALVTAYAGRNLIFEQRTSVNNQRAAQAFEAAESGLDFAIGLLSGGRVDAQCVSTNDVAQNTFRQRHLTQDPVTGSHHDLRRAGDPCFRLACCCLRRQARGAVAPRPCRTR